MRSLIVYGNPEETVRSKVTRSYNFLQKDDNVYSNLLLSCSFVSRSFERQHNYIFLLIYSLIMEGSKSMSFNENEVYEKYSKIYCVRYYTKTIAKITLSTDF